MTSAAAEQDAIALLHERHALMQKHPLFSFVPNAKQLEFIEHDTVKRKVMIGGNRLGKTVLVVVESNDHAIGCRPFLPYDHPNFRVRMPDGSPIPVPNVGQMCANDFPVGFQEDVWPHWEEWIPRGTYEVVKHERGVPRIIRMDVSAYEWADRSSSLYPYSYIYVHAYEQGRMAFEGTKSYWIMANEPPPRPVYIGQARGLIDHGGKWLGAMTVVEDPDVWIYDLFLPPKRRCRAAKAIEEMTGDHEDTFFMVQGSMYDNLKRPDGSGGLDPAHIEQFKRDLGGDETQIAVRVYGQQVHLLNTEFGKVWDDGRLVLEEHREPDPSCAFVVTCDAHPHKAYAIVFWEVDEHDQWYAWKESFDESLDTLDAICDFCREAEGWRKNNRGKWVLNSGPYAAQIRLIDPTAKTHEKGIGMTATQYMAMNHGLYWTSWGKGDKNAKTKVTREWLKPGKGPIARPRMTFSPECELTIHQMPRYRAKLPKDPTVDPDKGEFLDVDADLVQCVIAAANSGLTWEVLSGLRTTKGKVAPLRDPLRRGRALYYGPDEGEEDPAQEDFVDPFRQRRRTETI